MNEQWQELKETIIEMRDNDGACTQQEVCKFLANLMDVLEKQMSGSENEKDVLDKIIAEIDNEADYAYADFDKYKEDILHTEPDELPDDDFRYGLRRAIEIINKYKRKSEDK